VAVAGLPYPTHAVDVTDTFERGIASLAEHRSCLAALGDRSPEQQARDVYGFVTTRSAPGFVGRSAVTFQLVIG
jgi:hypothetical protein